MNQAPSLAKQFRAAGDKWVAADDRARRLESGLKREFARMVRASTEKSLAAAERDVRASQAYGDMSDEAERARTEANRALVAMQEARMELEEAKMRFDAEHGALPSSASNGSAYPWGDDEAPF